MVDYAFAVGMAPSLKGLRSRVEVLGNDGRRSSFKLLFAVVIGSAPGWLDDS